MHPDLFPRKASLGSHYQAAAVGIFTSGVNATELSFKEEAGFLGHSLLRRLATNTLEHRAGPDTKQEV
ncbi:hypothetical protein E2320_006838 [Naja naja]|nr:hypothetical protein E2320_006838 [Naja naja]